MQNIIDGAFNKTIEKPWGKEILFVPETLERQGKLLYINAGKRISLQYHDQKEETICLFSGKAFLHIGEKQEEMEKIEMLPQVGYTIKPFVIHRLEAIDDSIFVEVSSSEKGTTFRLNDDYRRGDETEDIRAEINRGWTK